MNKEDEHSERETVSELNTSTDVVLKQIDSCEQSIESCEVCQSLEQHLRLTKLPDKELGGINDD